MHKPNITIVPLKGRNPEIRYTDRIGKRRRISAGSKKKADVERKVKEIEARLLLDQPVETQRSIKKTKSSSGANIPWSEFSADYRHLKLANLRNKTQDSDESRLDCLDRILGRTPIGVVASKERLAEVKQQLLRGEGSRKGNRRKKTTVNSYLRFLQAALNWAHDEMGWLESSVKIPKFKTDDDGGEAKGRPITEDEFHAMVEAVPKVIRHKPEEYILLVKGMYYTGLRLDESMNFTFNDRSKIHVVESPSGLLIELPAKWQKNAKRQTIATIPDFHNLINKLPEEQRTGFVFNPAKRDAKPGRPTAGVVGNALTDIGEAAKIVVNDDGGYAGAHSLRRGFAQRMADLGMAPKDLKDVMRHASIETTMKYYTGKNAAAANERIGKLFG